MTSGYENFLSVVFIISQMPTFTPTEPIHVLLLFALYTKSIMKDARTFDVFKDRQLVDRFMGRF